MTTITLNQDSEEKAARHAETHAPFSDIGQE
jgi:hypothetical protein